MLDVKVNKDSQVTVSYEGELCDLAGEMSNAIKGVLITIQEEEGLEAMVSVMQHLMLYIMSGKTFRLNKKAITKLMRVTKQQLKEIEERKDEVM